MASTGLPEVADILRALERAKVRYEGRNNRVRAVRQRRWNLGPGPVIPDKFQKTGQSYRAPITRDLLRRTQSIIGDTFPDPRVPPTDPTSVDSNANAGDRERWLRAAYKRMDKHNHPRASITDALGADGESIFKCYLKMQKWGLDWSEDEDAEAYVHRVNTAQQQNFPFILEHVETTSFFPLSEDEDGYCEVVQFSLRERYALYEKYRDRLEGYGDLGRPQGNPDANYNFFISDDIPTVEYWNRDTYAYIVGNTLVDSGTHKYGRVPYYRAVFSPTSSTDPEFETEGIADPILQLQDRIEQLRTTQLNWAFLNGFPVARFRPATEDAVELDPTTVTVEWAPGETMNPVGGNIWEWVPAPGVGADISSLGAYFESMADKISLAPILYGQIEGTLSGPAAQSMIALARGIFGPAMQSLTAQWDELAGFMQKMVEEVIKVPVPVWDNDGGKWLTLGPKDIKGYYEVNHQLAPLTELERMSKSIWLGDAQARGAVSMRHYREEGIGLADPMAMDEEVKLEQAASSQAYQQLLMEQFTLRVKGDQPQPLPPVPMQTPEALPVGPGGPGIPQVAGVQQVMLPGFDSGAGGQMAAMPPPMSDPSQGGGGGGYV